MEALSDASDAAATSDELPPREEFLRLVGAEDGKSAGLLRV